MMSVSCTNLGGYFLPDLLGQAVNPLAINSPAVSTFDWH
jgi:hypothetical protein